MFYKYSSNKVNSSTINMNVLHVYLSFYLFTAPKDNGETNNNKYVQDNCYEAWFLKHRNIKEKGNKKIKYKIFLEKRSLNIVWL